MLHPFAPCLAELYVKQIVGSCAGYEYPAAIYVKLIIVCQELSKILDFLSKPLCGVLVALIIYYPSFMKTV